MTFEPLSDLLAAGEGARTEFKRAMPSDLGREICAFANATGGVILLGVTDAAEVVGIGGHNRLKSEILSIARSADPPIKVEVESEDSVLSVRVPPQSAKPYSFGGRFFVRDGASSQQLSRDEIREFFFAEGRIRFDETPCRIFSLERDIDEEIWETFRRRAKVPEGMAPAVALGNLGLLGDDGTMTHAGAFLLARDIRRFLSSADLACALFMGTTKTTILDRRGFHCDVCTMVDDAVAWVRSKINVAYIIRGRVQREERPELPMDAVREALVNAVAHRDYRSSASVHLYLFKDRLEVVSPGGLPAGMTEADLGTKSVPRNRLLFRLLHRMDAVEEIGSGIRRIRELCREHGVAEPTIETSEHWVTTTFRRPESGMAGGTGRSGDGRSSGAGEPESVRERPELGGKRPDSGGIEPEMDRKEPEWRQGQPEPGLLEPESVRAWRPGSLALRVLGVLEGRTLAKSAIAAALGQRAISGPLNATIRTLLAAGSIEFTIPEKPNSRLQRYRLTARGRKALVNADRPAEHPETP